MKMRQLTNLGTHGICLTRLARGISTSSSGSPIAVEGVDEDALEGAGVAAIEGYSSEVDSAREESSYYSHCLHIYKNDLSSNAQLKGIK